MIPSLSLQPVSKRRLAAILVFLITASFYIYTLSPSLAWGDGVRLQSEAISGESFILAEMALEVFEPDSFPFSRVGVTAWDHPLYIVLGYTLVRMLPSVDSLWLVNLISAIFGACSIVLVFLLCQRWTNSILASGYAALSLAVSHTFWWHSSTPEVYTLFIFLLLLSIYLYEDFEQTGRYSALIWSAFSMGLAMTNHILAALALPALVLYLLGPHNIPRIPSWTWNRLFPPALGFFAGFSLYIVQFLRLSREFELNRILGSAVGSTFLNGLGAFSPLIIAESLLTYLLFLFVQFGPVGIAVGILGFREVFQGSGGTSRKIVALYAVYTLFGIFYRVTDQFAFFMASHVFFAILIGMGTPPVFSALREARRPLLGLILILTLAGTPFLYRAVPHLAERNGIGDEVLGIPQVGTGLRNGLAYYIDPNKRDDFNAYRFADETQRELAPNALVIAEWYTDTDEYFVLRHFHKVMGVRPDITILGWPTEDPFSFDSRLVLDVVEESFPARPVYLASLSERFYSASTLIDKYCIVPENNLYRLYPHADGGRKCAGVDSITE